MGEHADAVAELKHEIRARQEVGVAAAYLDQHRRLVAWQIEIAQCPPHHRWTRSKHAQVVEVSPILNQVAGCRLAEDRARLRERLLAGSNGEQDVIFGND